MKMAIVVISHGWSVGPELELVILEAQGLNRVELDRTLSNGPTESKKRSAIFA